MKAALERWLRRPSLAWQCAALAVILALPAVGSHRVFDDFILALSTRSSLDAALPAHRFGVLDIFTFTNGLPSENHRLIDFGSMLPWWSDAELRVAFFRPLSALTHLWDQHIWPNRVWLQYLHSLLWLGLLVATVARLYRAIGGAPVTTGLAALMYAIDDAHGAAVSWLSNRNGLVAAVLGTVALVAHDDWRKNRRRRAAVLAACSLFAGLLAGESALATWAYLFAYAATLEQGSPTRRAATLLPYAGVTAAWAILYKTAGYAVRHSGVYVDPMTDPQRFVLDLPTHAMTLLGASFGPIPTDIALFEPGMEKRGLIAATITLVGVGWLLVPALRRERRARFWALGVLTATAPASACYPTDRLLPFVAIGAMPLVAGILAEAIKGAPAWPERPGFRGTARVVALALGVVHIGLSPVLFPLRAAQMRLVAHAVSPATEVLDRIEDLDRRTVVVVNPPIDAFVSYIQAERALRGVPRPKHLYWLVNAVAPIAVRRDGPRALTVEREGGLLSAPIETLYRRTSAGLHTGSVVSLSEMSAEIASTMADGRPRAVTFHFADALEADRYLFLVWDRGRFRPFAPPQDNETVRLPAQNMARLLLGALANRTEPPGDNAHATACTGNLWPPVRADRPPASVLTTCPSPSQLGRAP